MVTAEDYAVIAQRYVPGTQQTIERVLRGFYKGHAASDDAFVLSAG
jgi:hypothetical protein